MMRLPRVLRRQPAASAEAAAVGVPAPAVPEHTVAALADVVLLTRQGCHLCEQAQPVVVEVAVEHGVPVEVLDVDSDEQLRERYTDHVPVLFARGRLLDYWTVDGARLSAALAGEDVPGPAPL